MAAVKKDLISQNNQRASKDPAIFGKEESSNSFTQTDNDLLYQSCFEELKQAVRDDKGVESHQNMDQRFACVAASRKM